jgi:hypothetical protein
MAPVRGRLGVALALRLNMGYCSARRDADGLFHLHPGTPFTIARNSVLLGPESRTEQSIPKSLAKIIQCCHALTTSRERCGSSCTGSPFMLRDRWLASRTFSTRQASAPSVLGERRVCKQSRKC